VVDLAIAKTDIGQDRFSSKPTVRNRRPAPPLQAGEIVDECR